MSANIDMSNGRANMAYTGETPWHHEGTKMEIGAPLDEWLVAAGMGHTIKRAFVRYPVSADDINNPERWLTDKDNVVQFRSDTHAALGIVSAKFKTLQPRAVAEFFRDLVETGGMHIETMGSLYGGSKYWAMATVNDSEMFVVDKRDKLRQRLLLATACDGTMANIAKHISERVVCSNTLAIGLGESGMQVKVTHRSKFVAEDVKRELGIEKAQSAFKAQIEQLRAIADKPMPTRDFVLMTAGLLKPGFADLDSKQQQRVLNGKPMAEIGRRGVDLRGMGADYAGAKGTAYGWLNAVTEYVDHAALTRGDTADDNRLDSAWFGNGSALKTKALGLALAYAPSLDDIIRDTNEIFTKQKNGLDVI